MSDCYFFNKERKKKSKPLTLTKLRLVKNSYLGPKGTHRACWAKESPASWHSLCSAGQGLRTGQPWPGVCPVQAQGGWG